MIRSRWSPWISIRPSLTMPPVPGRVFNLVASSARPVSSSGKSEMIVTPLPPRPLVSRLTRTTVDLLGAGDSVMQVHVVLSCLHLGHSSFRQSSFPIVGSLLLADLGHRP